MDRSEHIQHLHQPLHELKAKLAALKNSSEITSQNTTSEAYSLNESNIYTSEIATKQNLEGSSQYEVTDPKLFEYLNKAPISEAWQFMKWCGAHRYTEANIQTINKMFN